ncbi:MAG TPA: DUF2497 domain-containing protein [Pseudolabrys sp.]|nr:DUF2497 domain-containing protein [Pseudolabrys sp.]
MTQTAKAQEPSMEEILASIRRIIADDDAGKPGKAPEPAAAAKAAPATTAAASGRSTIASANPPPKAAQAPASAAKSAAPHGASTANSQDEIDAMLAELDSPPKATPKASSPSPQVAPAPQSAPAQATPPAADVLDLTEAMAAPPPPPAAQPAAFRTIDGSPDVVFANRPEAPAAEHGLISNQTIRAVDSAFNTLAHTIIGQNARTLEDLVREMLRPMLKSWLDDNLPGMVERIVRAEIERVSRGRP